MKKFDDSDFAKIVDTANGFFNEFEDDLYYIGNKFNDAFQKNAGILNSADTDYVTSVIGKITSFNERIEKMDEKLTIGLNDIGSQILNREAGGFQSDSDLYVQNVLSMIKKLLDDVRGKINKYCDDFVGFDFSSKFSTVFANEQNYIKDAQKRAVGSIKGFTSWINLMAGTVIPQQMSESEERQSEKEKGVKNTNIIHDLGLSGDDADDLRDALDSLDI